MKLLRFTCVLALTILLARCGEGKKETEMTT